MSLKQDGTAPRTATDLERKYNFGRTFAEVFDLVTDAQKAAEEAQQAVEGLDHEEIFNRLTNYGEWQGIYRDDKGDVYINASYIKAGEFDGNLIKAESITSEKIAANAITADHIAAGSITATEIDATDLCVYGANIIGNVHLGGLIAVYDGIESNTVGGYIGYDEGFDSEYGIGIRINEFNLGSQVVCTDKAARISYSLPVGDSVIQTGMTCNQKYMVLEATEDIDMCFYTDKYQKYYVLGFNRNGIYVSYANATCGTEDQPWKDVYAAGTSMSALADRVAALENA